MNTLINKINEFVWGNWMIFILLGTHIYLTIKTKGVQRYVLKGIKNTFAKEKNGKGELSIFSALMTALSSTIGTGNIIGVGTAILAGGPGAVFWTWIGGAFGIATKYSESFIAIKHRKKNKDGSYTGGAMIVFEKLKKPILSKFFAICCALAAFGIGCATQSSAIADAIYENYGINTLVVGAILCILTAIVIFGGLKVIAKVCDQLVPLMSIVYIFGCFYILIFNYKYIPEAFVLIFKSAFSFRAAAGGFIGTTMKMAMSAGISRGLFSNEAGMGSAPQASATSLAPNAVKPALVGSTGVFWDTVVVCMMSGLVIVTSIIANEDVSCVLNDGSLLSSAALISRCFAKVPLVGTPLLTFGILSFAYSTILGWCYYGENCFKYLFGKKYIFIYRILWVVVIFLGTYFPETSLWVVANILNAIMCLPNILAIFLCRKEIFKDTEYYLHQNHLDEVDSSIQ